MPVMRTGRLALFALVALTGCGNLLGIEGLTAVEGDASVGLDTGIIPDEITITGRTVRVDSSIGSKLQVELHGPGDAPLATTMADPEGNFTIRLPRRDLPFRGFLELRDLEGSVVATRLFFARALVADTEVTATLFTEGSLVELAAIAGSSHCAGSSVMLMGVRELDDKPVANVSITLQAPGDLRYGREPDGLPEPMRQATGSTGVAWAFQVAPTIHLVTGRSLMGEYSAPPIAIAPGMVAQFTLIPAGSD